MAKTTDGGSETRDFLGWLFDEASDEEYHVVIDSSGLEDDPEFRYLSFREDDDEWLLYSDDGNLVGSIDNHMSDFVFRSFEGMFSEECPYVEVVDKYGFFETEPDDEKVLTLFENLDWKIRGKDFYRSRDRFRGMMYRLPPESDLWWDEDDDRWPMT